MDDLHGRQRRLQTDLWRDQEASSGRLLAERRWGNPRVLLKDRSDSNGAPLFQEPNKLRFRATI